MRALCVHPQVGLRVGEPPGGKQPLHLRPIRRKRPPPVGGQPPEHVLERHVEPDRQTVPVHRRPVVRIDERAAARGHDDVAQGQEQLQDLALECPEVGLAVPAEDVRHRPAFARFDQLVHVLRMPAEPSRQRPGDRRLARRHEPHEEDLIDRHRR